VSLNSLTVCATQIHVLLPPVEFHEIRLNLKEQTLYLFGRLLEINFMMSSKPLVSFEHAPKTLRNAVVQKKLLMITDSWFHLPRSIVKLILQSKSVAQYISMIAMYELYPPELGHRTVMSMRFYLSLHSQYNTISICDWLNNYWHSSHADRSKLACKIDKTFLTANHWGSH